jgi:uncharacterized integral membrane protein
MMPWKFIAYLCLSFCLLLFAAFNVGTAAPVSLVFVEVGPVPVFIIVFASWVLGFLTALPLALRRKKARKEPDKASDKASDKTSDTAPEDKGAEKPEAGKDDAAGGAEGDAAPRGFLSFLKRPRRGAKAP